MAFPSSVTYPHFAGRQHTPARCGMPPAFPFSQRVADSDCLIGALTRHGTLFHHTRLLLTVHGQRFARFMRHTTVHRLVPTRRFARNSSRCCLRRMRGPTPPLHLRLLLPCVGSPPRLTPQLMICHCRLPLYHTAGPPRTGLPWTVAARTLTRPLRLDYPDYVVLRPLPHDCSATPALYAAVGTPRDAGLPWFAPACVAALLPALAFAGGFAALHTLDLQFTSEL